MRIRSLLILTVLTVFAIGTGCTESVAGPAPVSSESELVGRWVSARDALSADSWHQSSLTFTIDGRFVFENRSYGLYEGQRRDDLSAWTRTEGVYRIEGDRLSFEPRQLAWWDRFYGVRSAEHVEQPYPWQGLFDDATYTVRDDRFVMEFSVYPADAPLAAVVEFTRER